jgi:hypothetical protein
VLQLADDIRQQRHRVARDVRDAQRLADEVTPGEFWWRGGH